MTFEEIVARLIVLDTGIRCLGAAILIGLVAIWNIIKRLRRK
jgi:hypothetical protein